MMAASSPRGGVAPVSRRVMNLAHFVRQAASLHRNEIGLVWGEATWTWSDLDRRIDAMAAALAAKGVSKGDRVLVQSKNCNQLFESMFVCFRLGAVWVPANFRQTPDEIAYLAEASGATAMICHSEFPDHAVAVRAASPDVSLVVSIGARVAAKAGPSQVLISQTVKDLVAGSGLTFEDAGEHELKGVPDRWRLFRVTS